MVLRQRCLLLQPGGLVPLVVDFALAAMPARRRKMLKAAAERYALESGAHEIEKLIRRLKK